MNTAQPSRNQGEITRLHGYNVTTLQSYKVEFAQSAETLMDRGMEDGRMQDRKEHQASNLALCDLSVLSRK